MASPMHEQLYPNMAFDVSVARWVCFDVPGPFKPDMSPGHVPGPLKPDMSPGHTPDHKAVR